MTRTTGWVWSSLFFVLLAVSLTPAALVPSVKPEAEHQRLGYFVGKWTGSGQIRPGPMGPGGRFTSTDTCEWFDGGFAVVCRTEGQTPNALVKTLGIMSYSAEEEVYTYYGVDNTKMTMATVPRGTVEGDTWTYHDERPIDGQKVKMRITLKEQSPTVYTFLMEMQGPDGQWLPFVESRNTKVD
jgi:hypothetical protein